MAYNLDFQPLKSFVIIGSYWICGCRLIATKIRHRVHQEVAELVSVPNCQDLLQLISVQGVSQTKIWCQRLSDTYIIFFPWIKSPPLHARWINRVLPLWTPWLSIKMIVAGSRCRSKRKTPNDYHGYKRESKKKKRVLMDRRFKLTVVRCVFGASKLEFCHPESNRMLTDPWTDCPSQKLGDWWDLPWNAEWIRASLFYMPELQMIEYDGSEMQQWF